jgi:hypothetical protein
MSTAMMLSEKTITSVIDHQFVSLLENISMCNSLEISGFGKFLFNKNKAIVTMQNYIKGLANFKNELAVCTEPQEIKRIEFRISGLELRMKALNQKLQSYENQFRSNLGRMEKLPDSL